MDLHAVLKKLHPNKDFVSSNDSLNESYFHDGTPMPSAELAEATWQEILIERANESFIYRCTPKQFLERFTQSERIKIIKSGRTNDIIEDFRSLCMASTEVVSNDPTLLAGMSYLVSQNLITEQRKNEILLIN